MSIPALRPQYVPRHRLRLRTISARLPSRTDGADVTPSASRVKYGVYPSKGDTIDMVPSKDARLAPEYQNNVSEFPNNRRGALQKGAQKGVTTRRRWRRQKTEGAVVLPRRTFPGQPQRRFADGLHRPVGLVFASGHLLWTACQLSGVTMGPVWGPAAVGAVVGAAYAALNRLGMKRIWRAPYSPLNVVVTGGTRGLGKAMAREFLKCGDKVYISSRSMATVRKTMTELREEVGGMAWVAGIECDVSSPASVQRLMSAATSQMGSVDVWINNAGNSGSFQSFLDASPEQITEVVQTNLLGTLLCTRAAMQALAAQKRGGHIFNMDGAGANNLPSPMYAAYGATKAGIAHLMGSLNKEAQDSGSPVRVHCLSPGMVLTDLLLAGATARNKQVFNILCEQPETVAAFLVPRARTVAARGQTGRYIKFLTLPRAMLRFLTAPLHSNRFFDGQGEPVYPGERERILGQKARRTRRLAARAARRSKELAMAYALSLAGAYLIMATGKASELPL
ncbi:g6440 [Coccomyxa viridis]|uniref:G6440 protein n=1 Tax=Coccomyxa viridis TaxID=1274662 RepID=A0ABP1FVD9_9CHLO